MMDFSRFIEWAFLGIIAGSVAWCANFLSRIARSIQSLNIQLATVLERMAAHARDIEDHHQRIARLERRE